MHLGLNLVYWQPDSGGSGTYARGLVEGLHAVEPGLRMTGWLGTGAPPGVEDLPVEWVRLPLRSSGSPVHVAYELGLLGLDARRRGVDLVHGLAYAAPALAPGVRTAVTLLDLTWWHDPASVTPLARRMFRLLTEVCGRTADRVVAISEWVKRDLVETAGIPARKIDVTPLGVPQRPRAAPTPEAPLRARLGLPPEAPVVLCVAQLAAHKNLGALVRALPAGAWLVIAGRHTPYRDELVAAARARGVEERLVLPGFVDDADLEGLYALAACLALPSFWEGFGLPVVEAMARGVPVACSDTGPLPEVAGGAAELFDPRDDASIAAALGRVLADPEGRAGRGRRRAAELTWERTARATLEVYARCMSA